MQEPDNLPLPDLYLLDSQKLIKELDRIRELVLVVPFTEGSYSAMQTVVDAIWRLRENLQEILRVKAEINQSWQLRGTEIDKAQEPPRIALKIVES